MPGLVSAVTLTTSTSVTTQGTGPTIDCTGWGSLMVMASVTSGIATSASVSAFRVWAQGQLNPGGVWTDLPFVYAAKSFAGANLAAAAASVTQGSASLVSEAVAISGPFSYIGILNAPPPAVRIAWNIVIVSGSPFVQFATEGLLSAITGQ